MKPITNVSLSLPDVKFGSFSDRVIELCNHAFVPMYFHVIKKYWNNSMFARVRSPTFYSDMDSGVFEVCLPTLMDVEENMGYYRIVIQVIPELSNENKREYANSLKKPFKRPMGRIDSEFIVLVAPTRTLKAKRERQFVRGYRQKAGFMVGTFLSKVPEIVVKNILIVIAKFLRTRLKKFIEAFRLNDWWEGATCWIDKKYPLYYKKSIVNVIERISLSMTSAVKCIFHMVRWIDQKIRDLLAEIGKQSMIQLAIKKIDELKPLLWLISQDQKGFGSRTDLNRLLEPLLVVSQAGKQFSKHSSKHRPLSSRHHRWVDSRLPRRPPSG